MMDIANKDSTFNAKLSSIILGILFNVNRTFTWIWYLFKNGAYNVIITSNIIITWKNIIMNM